VSVTDKCDTLVEMSDRSRVLQE